MPDILIRGLSRETIKRLKAKAKENQRSLQSEAKRALEEAAGWTLAESIAAAAEFRESLGRRVSDSTLLLREDRAR